MAYSPLYHKYLPIPFAELATIVVFGPFLIGKLVFAAAINYKIIVCMQ